MKSSKPIKVHPFQYESNNLTDEQYQKLLRDQDGREDIYNNRENDHNDENHGDH